MNVRKRWQRVCSGLICSLFFTMLLTAGASALGTTSDSISSFLQEIGLLESTQAASSTYADELAKFPTSYQDDLEALHEDYPNWIFIAEYVDCDWEEALDAQLQSATISSGSEWLRSQQYGDYDPSTGTYTEADAGSVYAASESMTSYYMDPRNFLNEDYIFQFEALSYDATYHTLAGVEAILDGTWMDTSNITYTTTSGSTATYDKTYAEVIYQAGVDSGTSPYYLASKIIHEIGSSSASGSASGNYSGYTGYYNFYCIGAYNGTSPIANGLSYAKSAGWDTPMAAISGGAEWIASGYINRSSGPQDTLYYQRFNVVAYSDSDLYTHQYATNVNYAAVQSPDVHDAYEDISMLNTTKIFYIPVYDDMPGEDAQSSTVTLSTTSTSDTGTITGSSVNLRQSPTTSSSSVGTVSTGQTVTIVAKYRTTSTGTTAFQTNPYWYKVTTSSGTTGYISAEFVSLDSNVIYLTPGSTYQLGATLSNAGTGEVCIYSTRDLVATVSDSGKITAKTAGTCNIVVYTTGGGFDYVTVKVGSSYTNSTSTASAIASSDQMGNGTSSTPDSSTPNTESGVTAPTTDTSYTAVVIKTANIRKGGSVTYDIATTYDIGKTLNITEMNGYWGKTSDGWIHTDYINATMTGFVDNTSYLNVRSSASMTGGWVTSISANTTLKIFEVKIVDGTPWYLTNRGGWVCGDYVTLNGESDLSTDEVVTNTKSLAATVTTTLNIRSSTSTSASKVGSYGTDTTIYITEMSGYWGKTDKGWVHTDYVDGAFEVEVVNTSYLNVRSTAGITGTQVATVAKGTVLKVYASCEVNGTTWYLVNYGGWVTSDYVEVV